MLSNSTSSCLQNLTASKSNIQRSLNTFLFISKNVFLKMCLSPIIANSKKFFLSSPYDKNVFFVFISLSLIHAFSYKIIIKPFYHKTLISLFILLVRFADIKFLLILSMTNEFIYPKYSCICFIRNHQQCRDIVQGFFRTLSYKPRAIKQDRF